MIQSAIVARLKTLNSNVYASVAPENAPLPCMTVGLESSFRSRHYGSSSIETGLITTDFEITVWGKRNSDCYALAQSVIDSFQDFTGPLAGMESPVQVYSVAYVEITGEQSGFDGQTKLYQYSIYLEVTHDEG